MCCLSLALLSICETAGSKLAHTLILSNFATSLFAFPTLFGICLAAEYKKRWCCSVLLFTNKGKPLPIRALVFQGFAEVKPGR